MCPIEGYYSDPDLRICGTCVRNCKYCVNDQLCQTCKNDFVLNATKQCVCDNSLVDQNGVCQAQCDSGFYLSDTTCLSCPAECNSCNPDTTCIDCSDNVILEKTALTCQCKNGLYYNRQTATCGQCLTHYFGDPTTLICVLCSDVCNDCETQADRCTSCNSPKLFYDYDCLDSCPQKTYLSSDSCVDCPADCLNCTSATNCSLCATNKVLQGTLC